LSKRDFASSKTGSIVSADHRVGLWKLDADVTSSIQKILRIHDTLAVEKTSDIVDAGARLSRFITSARRSPLDWDGKARRRLGQFNAGRANVKSIHTTGFV